MIIMIVLIIIEITITCHNYLLILVAKMFFLHHDVNAAFAFVQIFASK